MKAQRRLYSKFVLVLVAVVSSAVGASGALQAWYSYTAQVSAARSILQTQAEAVGGQVEQFMKELERQVGWTTHFSWPETPLEQRKLDAARLLRQAPEITEFVHLDPDGREQIKFSRINSTVVGSGTDFSSLPLFTAARPEMPYFGPVEFLRNSEPHMTIGVAGARRANGVSVAQINLKFIWDLMRETRVGAGGRALVVDDVGRLISHRDVLLVLQNNDVSGSEQYQVAVRRIGDIERAHKNFLNDDVFSGASYVESLRWHVIVELPKAEVLEPIHASMWRTAYLLLLGVGVAFASGLFLTQQVLKPVRALHEGASRIAAGNFGQPLEVRSGDEFQALAEQFNDMARDLLSQRATLEQTVSERTYELAKVIQELKELGRVSRQINSTLVIHSVVGAILKGAVQLSRLPDAAIYLAVVGSPAMELAAKEGASEFPPTLSLASENLSRHKGVGGVSAVSEISRSHFVLPLTRQGEAMGALVLQSSHAVPKYSADVLNTFVSQSAMALLNAKLYNELEHRSRQLETASEYKTRFLANMSHELRTPLNAIIGFGELLLEGAYGLLGPRATNSVDRIVHNGRDLLGLISEILDLSRIEMGQYELDVNLFSLEETIAHVIQTMTPLAQAKGLAIISPKCTPSLPLLAGDERRITQVLLNLVTNAIKFTREGVITINRERDGDTIELSVTDTGVGIAPEEQQLVFLEFHQVGPFSARLEGGSGLGLAISKRIVECHGGSITVDSTLGLGSTFRVRLPIKMTSPSSLI